MKTHSFWITLLSLCLTASALATPTTPLYEKWDQAFQKGTPATLKDFPSSPSERPNLECSKVILPQTQHIEYEGNAACYLDISRPEGSYKGVAYLPKNFPLDYFFAHAAPTEVKKFFSSVDGLDSKTVEEAQGVLVTVTGVNNSISCKILWKVAGNILISKQDCPGTPEHAGLVVCRDRIQAVAQTPPPPPPPQAANNPPPIDCEQWRAQCGGRFYVTNMGGKDMISCVPPGTQYSPPPVCIDQPGVQYFCEPSQPVTVPGSGNCYDAGGGMMRCE